MALQAKYDPRQDRMLLTLDVKKQDTGRSFWLTRVQWLGLMVQLAAVSEKPVDDGGALPPRKSAPQPLPPQPNAVMAEGLKLRREGEGVRVAIGTGPDAVGLMLQGESLANFRRMLVTQAERAGWDPRAALERINAARAAGQAMKKAKGE